jgi:radical SAM protein with 4Fe4S-binding SPASM domain
MSCTAADLARRLQPAKHRIPLEGVVETTFRCNLSCAHCYVAVPAASRQAQASEMLTGTICRIVDEAAASGCLFLTFTGGEVLLRPDFPEVYLHALRAGLLVSVFTNGTLVTEQVADLFEGHRPLYVEVTLYGMTEATYERVTGVRGSYERCREGIDRLLARGIAVRLKTMALAWNVHEIQEIEAYARGLGVRFRWDGLLNARVDCGSSRIGQLQLAPARLVALDTASVGRLEERRAFAERLGPRRDDGRLLACGAGRTGFAVDPFGRLHPCLLLRRDGYDLLRGSFEAGWSDHVARLVERQWKTQSPCRSCILVAFCDSCPGANELEWGEPERAVPLFCEVAHRRARAALGACEGHETDASCCACTGRRTERP